MKRIVIVQEQILLFFSVLLDSKAVNVYIARRILKIISLSRGMHT